MLIFDLDLWQRIPNVFACRAWSVISSDSLQTHLQQVQMKETAKNNGCVFAYNKHKPKQKSSWMPLILTEMASSISSPHWEDIPRWLLHVLAIKINQNWEKIHNSQELKPLVTFGQQEWQQHKGIPSLHWLTFDSTEGILTQINYEVGITVLLGVPER